MSTKQTKGNDQPNHLHVAKVGADIIPLKLKRKANLSQASFTQVVKSSQQLFTIIH
jgi:hypothetical protein